jgi:hypothetical protein
VVKSVNLIIKKARQRKEAKMFGNEFPLVPIDPLETQRRLYPELFMPSRSLVIPENPGENFLPALKVLKSTALQKTAIESLAASSLAVAERAGDAMKIAVAQGILDRKRSINASFDSNYDYDRGICGKGMRLSWRASIWTD